jgi:ubiquinol-cytochrome c reductase cytochrome b subunit
MLLLVPVIDRMRWTKDSREHHLLQRPRENPERTAFVAAGVALIAVVFLFGASDRLFLTAGIGYELQLWIARGLAITAPVLTYMITLRTCRELRASEADVSELRNNP